MHPSDNLDGYDPDDDGFYDAREGSGVIAWAVAFAMLLALVGVSLKACEG